MRAYSPNDAGIKVDALRGLDHGAWAPLSLMYPAADIPVIQLAVMPEADAAAHYELGRRLAPLASEGVLVLASGSLTHNLYEMIPDAPDDRALPHVAAFSDWFADQLGQWQGRGVARLGGRRTPRSARASDAGTPAAAVRGAGRRRRRGAGQRRTSRLPARGTGHGRLSLRSGDVEADLLFHRVGITFAVYGESAGTERLIPFDIMPRIIPACRMAVDGEGLRQRVQGAQRLPARHLPRAAHPEGGRIPREFILGNEQFQPAMQGVDVPNRHLCAHRRRRHRARTATASTTCWRTTCARRPGCPTCWKPQDDDAALPRAVRGEPVAPVEHYPDLLLETCESSRPWTTPPSCC
jgi:hypothetical protein